MIIICKEKISGSNCLLMYETNKKTSITIEKLDSRMTVCAIPFGKPIPFIFSRNLFPIYSQQLIQFCVVFIVYFSNALTIQIKTMEIYIQKHKSVLFVLLIFSSAYMCLRGNVSMCAPAYIL